MRAAGAAGSNGGQGGYRVDVCAAGLAPDAGGTDAARLVAGAPGRAGTAERGPLRGGVAAVPARGRAEGRGGCGGGRRNGRPALARALAGERCTCGRTLGVARRRDVAMQSKLRWLERAEVERRFSGGFTLGAALRAECDRLISALSEEEKLWVTAGPCTADDDAAAASAAAAAPLAEVGEARHRLVGREALEHLVRRHKRRTAGAGSGCRGGSRRGCSRSGRRRSCGRTT
eukprot:5135790-Prymnesium_polylepis.1